MRGRVSQAEVPQLVVYSPIACSTSCGFEPVNDRTTSTISSAGRWPHGWRPPKSARSRICRSRAGTTSLQLSVMASLLDALLGATSGLAPHSRPALDAAVVLARKSAPLGEDHVGPEQLLLIPAVLFGVEMLHRFARDHVLVVEFV